VLQSIWNSIICARQLIRAAPHPHYHCTKVSIQPDIGNFVIVIENKTKINEGSLSDRILKEIQAADWSAIKAFVYSKDRAEIAALSKIVDQAAEAGDAEAISILKKAAGHLGDLVNRTDSVLLRKSLPVKFTGGISGSKILYAELEKFLRMRVSISTVDIALRAAELAR